jgi:DNA-binding transcriptional LysR family regulator
VVVPPEHPLAARKSIAWKNLAEEPLIVLARREGVGLHDAFLTGCRQAAISPRLAYTPSLIGTVLSYVEAGAGAGIVVESVVTPESQLRFIRLKPAITVPLVFVWQEHEDTPAVQRFRELVAEWQKSGRLWKR